MLWNDYSIAFNYFMFGYESLIAQDGTVPDRVLLADPAVAATWLTECEIVAWQAGEFLVLQGASAP